MQKKIQHVRQLRCAVLKTLFETLCHFESGKSGNVNDHLHTCILLEASLFTFHKPQDKHCNLYRQAARNAVEYIKLQRPRDLSLHGYDAKIIIINQFIRDALLSVSKPLPIKNKHTEQKYE